MTIAAFFSMLMLETCGFYFGKWRHSWATALLFVNFVQAVAWNMYVSASEGPMWGMLISLAAVSITNAVVFAVLRTTKVRCVAYDHNDPSVDVPGGAFVCCLVLGAFYIIAF